MQTATGSSPGWSPWHSIPLAAGVQLRSAGTGTRALYSWQSVSFHSLLVEIRFMGGKAKSQPCWNNDSQPDSLGMGREKQSHRLALKGKGLALPGWVLGRLRGGG